MLMNEGFAHFSELATDRANLIRLPFILLAPRRGYDLVAYVHEAGLAVLKQSLTRHGALLFRDFEMTAVQHFEGFLDALAVARMDYVYGSTPRTPVSRNVFTATEYPRQQEILLHNELAFQRTWPSMLSFVCLEVPTSGGQTTLADMRCVTADIRPELLSAFGSRGVRYVRHYRNGVDVPWQTVFQTSSIEGLAAFCAQNDMQFEWLDDSLLRTVQICQGMALHPLTQERVFFNQAHMFHPSALGSEAEAALIDMFGADRLPRNAVFGDGGAIERSDLQHVRDAFRSHAVDVEWRRGDVLLLDNMRVAHGRRTYVGQRRVLAALLDPVSCSR
jgi:alpha-ketoglutarate-dependent taurine dioxygenase